MLVHEQLEVPVAAPGSTLRQRCFLFPTKSNQLPRFDNPPVLTVDDLTASLPLQSDGELLSYPVSVGTDPPGRDDAAVAEVDSRTARGRRDLARGPDQRSALHRPALVDGDDPSTAQGRSVRCSGLAQLVEDPGGLSKASAAGVPRNRRPRHRGTPSGLCPSHPGASLAISRWR